MYAVIEDSGRQFKVESGDTIDIDLRELPADQEQIAFDRVLMIGDGENSKVGTPTISGAKVLASIQGPMKGPKLEIIKFRRRKSSQVKKGHRQHYLRVTITDIQS